MPAFPQLTTQRLLLRELQKKDAARLAELLRDPDVSGCLSRDFSNITVKQQRGFIKRNHKAFLQGKTLQWGICDRATGVLMGCINKMPIDRGNRSATAGFWLGKAYWGQGYMTEAFQAVLTYCFEEMHLNRVSAGHLEDNAASGRVMRKCGLQYEGTHRQALYLREQYRDVLMYAILREDYLNSHK